MHISTSTCRRKETYFASSPAEGRSTSKAVNGQGLAGHSYFLCTFTHIRSLKYNLLMLITTTAYYTWSLRSGKWTPRFNETLTGICTRAERLRVIYRQEIAVSPLPWSDCSGSPSSWNGSLTANSRSESTKVVTDPKSSKPAKVKTTFEATEFLGEIIRFLSWNQPLNLLMSMHEKIIFPHRNIHLASILCGTAPSVGSMSLLMLPWLRKKDSLQGLTALSWERSDPNSESFWIKTIIPTPSYIWKTFSLLHPYQINAM